MDRLPDDRGPSRRFVRPVIALAMVLLALGLWWTFARGGHESAVPLAEASSPTAPAPAADAGVPAAEETPARSTVEAPAPPAPEPPRMLPVEVRVLDESAQPLAAATVDLWIVPHDVEAGASGRRLAPTAQDGTTRSEIALAEVRTGFPLNEEQLRERERARSSGYVAVPIGEPPTDPDVVALRVDARVPGFRPSETRFEFSVPDSLATGSAMVCEVRLAKVPEGPLLHLTVLEAGTLAPIPGAVLRLASGEPFGAWIYAVTDRDGCAQQLIGVKLDGFGQSTDDPRVLASLPRSEGIPTNAERVGAIRHVLVEHFPDHAPAQYWFQVSEDFLRETDCRETILLEPRKYLSIRLIDRTTGEPIVGADFRARFTFIGPHPLEDRKVFSFLDTEFTQTITLESSPIRVGLDMISPSALVVRVEKRGESKGANHQPASTAHYVDAAEFPIEGQTLDVPLASLRPWTFYLHNLELPGHPVIERARVVFRTTYVADFLGWRERKRAVESTFEWDEESFRYPLPGQPERQLGALRLSWGWAENMPDIQSFSLDCMLISGIGSASYEIQSADGRVLAPWAEDETVGRFVPPLPLIADGLPVLGDDLGIVHLYVRRKGP